MSVNDEEDTSDGNNETPGSMTRSVSLLVDNGDDNDASSQSTNTNHSHMNLNINEKLQHECDTNFINMKIDDDELRWRLQDAGCAQSELPRKTYMKSRIAGYGPSEALIFYYNLTSIGIDYLRNFKAQNELGRGWNKIPKM